MYVAKYGAVEIPAALKAHNLHWLLPFHMRARCKSYVGAELIEG